ncbi:Rhodanese-like domain-containing protein [Cladochytrium replicatum]|nr:Rhodanese-like domain-containing protein [Cladochytrium replicatum]
MGGQLQEPNWWDAYPAVVSKPDVLTADRVAELVRDTSKVPGKDYLVVDVRRKDYGGGHVRGSANHHAQSFHDDLHQIVDKYASVPMVIFYCNSSRGRGPRCAGWYQDALDERKITTSKGLVLEGGIKGWVELYGNDPTLTEGFDPEWWKTSH